ncbi:Endoglucanase 11 [Triticum urartu]|uniref:Endoglucanase n=1 Tax=Triticum urartu TaxID=4572 RepID=M7ZMS4_TRIUA|nr:Endoglucanase 11 [Triticum urartu]
MSNSAPSSRAAVFLAFSLVWFSSHVLAAGHPDYADALAKSLLFFQGQRSGRLPPDQAVKWRSNSAMSDGSAANVDLTGGYYDGGNNVKFNFPMAFTATMLSWSIIEYGGRMDGRVHDARAADELLWGCAWLLWATKNSSYLNDLISLGANDDLDVFSWDNKLAGARVLLSRRALLDGDERLEPFTRQAEEFICHILPNSSSPSSTTAYTPGGLMHRPGNVNMQYVASASFLLTTYAKYMATSRRRAFSCQNSRPVTHRNLRALAKRQVDYVLGDNPLGMSYMVGYGARYPQRIHHRASSMPSVAAHPAHIGCQEGYRSYLNAPGPNPNVHTGAVVGGPDENDAFPDDRVDYARSEPVTYTNAPLVGCLAYFAGSYKN